MSEWQPHEDTQAILDFAMTKIKSVPYNVSVRWVFYQCVQAGLIEKKDITSFTMLLSKARKHFYNGWHPSLLADSVRECDFKGEQYAGFGYENDSINEQDYYVQLWFEAEAMHGQFEHYTKDYRVSLIPFRGECSIPIKWQIAKKLENMHKKYQLPIKILYFGDCDQKGLEIFENALRDIKVWCHVEFAIERIGLTDQQAKTFNLPENPNKPGTYQWEALNNEQAGNLILEALTKYQRKPCQKLLDHEKHVKEIAMTKLWEILEQEKYEGEG